MTDTSVIDLAGSDPPPLPGPATSWAPGEKPVGNADSILPQNNFLKDAGYDPAKSAEVSHQLAGIEQKKLDAITWADQQAEGRLEQDRSRMDHAYRLEAASAEDPALRPWNAEQARSSMIRGPLEQFGSIGSIFAMAASAFTRQPMVSALNAGAAAMTAIHQSDEEAYKSAYQAWKDNSALALKRFDMERTLYEDANKLATTDMSLWQQKRLSIAAQFDDQKTILMMQNGMIKEVLEKDSHAVDMAEKLRKADEGFQEFNFKKDIIASRSQAWLKDHPRLQPNDPGYSAWLNEFSRIKLLATAEAARATKGGENPEEKFNRMMTLETAKEQARAAEGKENRQAAMDRLVATIGSRQEIAELSDDRIRELAGNQIDMRERLEKERETARSAEGDKNRESKEKIAAGRGGTARTLAAEKVDVIEKAKAEFREANGGREPNATESKDIITKATTGADKPTLSDETQTYMAKQYMQGDRSVLQNLGRGAQGAANLIALREKVMEIAKKENISPVELATRMTEFSGMLAAQRTLGVRTANVEMFNNEAINMMSIARQASRDFPRTQFPAINKAIIAYDSNTGDPKVRAFGAAINEVVNTYSKAINGGNAGTVHDKENARELLKDIDTPEQFEAVLKIMEQGLQQARKAPGQVREELRNLSGGGSTIEQGKVPPPQNVIRYNAQGNRIQ